MKLGVNIDHVATVREARKTFEPSPIEAAIICEKSGADGIVAHLRKDRRHINDNDILRLKAILTTKLNLEMSIDPEIVDIALKVHPEQATFVPENREEITTEGGLDVLGEFDRVHAAARKLLGNGTDVSLFIDPVKEQVDAAIELGVKIIEFHTGGYAEAFVSGGDYISEIEKLKEMTDYARMKDIVVCAGHGLTYENVKNISKIEGIYELNIGHSIISNSIYLGLGEAVKKMKELII